MKHFCSVIEKWLVGNRYYLLFVSSLKSDFIEDLRNNRIAPEITVREQYGYLGSNTVTSYKPEGHRLRAMPA